MTADALRGYRLTVEHLVDGRRRRDVYDNRSEQEVDAVMRVWRRLAWLRPSTLLLGDSCTGAEQVVLWKDVLGIHVQPQREAIA